MSRLSEDPADLVRAALRGSGVNVRGALSISVTSAAGGSVRNVRLSTEEALASAIRERRNLVIEAWEVEIENDDSPPDCIIHLHILACYRRDDWHVRIRTNEDEARGKKGRRSWPKYRHIELKVEDALRVLGSSIGWGVKIKVVWDALVAHQ